MIPFSYLIGILKGVDIRHIGSGNIGATNLGRTLGAPFFIIGFVLDGLKGFVPVMVIKGLGLPAALCGAGAIIGHVFNPFFRFRGGKGVSTTIGATVGIIPKSFFIALGVWILVYIMTFLVSLASVCFAAVLPFIALWWQEGTLLDRIFVLLMAILVIAAHRGNVKRLINKQEPRTYLWRRK